MGIYGFNLLINARDNMQLTLSNTKIPFGISSNLDDISVFDLKAPTHKGIIYSCWYKAGKAMKMNFLA